MVISALMGAHLVRHNVLTDASLAHLHVVANAVLDAPVVVMYYRQFLMIGLVKIIALLHLVHQTVL